MQPDQSQENISDKPPVVSPEPGLPGAEGTPKSGAAKPPSSDPPPSGNSMRIGIRELFSDKTDFINEQHNITNYIQGISNIIIRQFSFNDIWRITAEKQQEIAELFVADPAELERLRSFIVARRVIVITGESSLGRTAAAIYLSGILATNGTVKSLDTYVIPSQDRNLKIDLNEFCKPGEITNRVVIFKDAFASGNLDLRGFFAQSTEFSMNGFADKLRQNNSYLIFIATTPEAVQLLPSHASNEFQHELCQLSDRLLVEGLERRLAYLRRARTFPAASLEKLAEPQAKEILIKKLRTMPRIVRFVEFYLRQDPTAASRVDLDEVIRQFEDITYSFQQDLTGDFDTWCFTLSLGLAHCLPDSQGVPWIDFEYLHRNVSRWLKRDPQLFPSKGNSNEPASSEPSENKLNLTEDVYLAKCRAEVIKDPNTLADVIRFCEESYPRKLWEILRRHHRRVLSTLLPRLREIAEDYHSESDPQHRELCARIIGRIGEIDPDRVTLNLMNRWIASDDVRQRANIGSLYEGILASDAEPYWNYFLEVLKSLTVFPHSNEELSEDERKEQKDRLLTAIAVYAKIGAYDLTPAMDGLKSIAQNKLVSMMDEVQRIGRLVERTASEFAKQTSADEALGLLIFEEMLKDLAERIYAEQGSTFVGVQYALSSLCLRTDPVSVFKELRLWIESSNRATGALVAFMFLIKDGIASTLESIQLDFSGNEPSLSGRKTCNPITANLTSGHDALIEMARFLVTIFEAFSATFFLPKQVQDYLRKSFMSHLTTWIEEALPIEICRQAIEKLFIELMRIHNNRLSIPIENLFNSRTFLKHQPDLKRAFVNAVLWPVR